jgi:hypothetical protein
MTLYSFFLDLHSGFRYIVLLLVLVAIIRAWADWLGKKDYSEGNRKLNLFALISMHSQLFIGIVLYFISPFVQFNSQTMKDASTRYWTIGHSKSKKIATAEGKHKTIAIYYTVAMLIIIITIILSKRGLLGMS